jgi:hypothetical protein
MNSLDALLKGKMPHLWEARKRVSRREVNCIRKLAAAGNSRRAIAKIVNPTEQFDRRECHGMAGEGAEQ